MMARPKWLLHAEGAAVFLASLIVYGERGYHWWLFIALFLLPDISMLGYLVSVETGARLYNLAHTEVIPVLLGLAALLYRPSMLAYALIWLAHTGFDRALGYGLKYPTRFADTHLAHV
jgi:ABC-type multidrug transport system permease subunit